uniref:receptor protein-tyrosine kinase n=1 Tax=Macrostomum lignano TaxID=282301 RepID=A0A1I8G307_9PLAT
RISEKRKIQVSRSLTEALHSESKMSKVVSMEHRQTEYNEPGPSRNPIATQEKDGAKISFFFSVQIRAHMNCCSTVTAGKESQQKVGRVIASTEVMLLNSSIKSDVLNVTEVSSSIECVALCQAKRCVLAVLNKVMQICRIVIVFDSLKSAAPPGAHVNRLLGAETGDRVWVAEDFAATIARNSKRTFLNSSSSKNGSIQLALINVTGCYRIVVAGAKGGDNPFTGGRRGFGAVTAGSFNLTAGTQLSIVVGQAGGSANLNTSGAGGGGGSFVYRTADQHLLMAAGGGGGCSCCKNGVSGKRDQNGADSNGNYILKSGLGGTNGGPGFNEPNKTKELLCHGGCGAGWLGRAVNPRRCSCDGERGGGLADGWAGGSAGESGTGDGGFGGGGGGGGNATSPGAAGAGGGFSGGGAGVGRNQAGGGGGSFCNGSDCIGVTGGNSAGEHGWVTLRLLAAGTCQQTSAGKRPTGKRRLANVGWQMSAGKRPAGKLRLANVPLANVGWQTSRRQTSAGKRPAGKRRYPVEDDDIASMHSPTQIMRERYLPMVKIMATVLTVLIHVVRPFRVAQFCTLSAKCCCIRFRSIMLTSSAKPALTMLLGTAAISRSLITWFQRSACNRTRYVQHNGVLVVNSTVSSQVLNVHRIEACAMLCGMKSCSAAVFWKSSDLCQLVTVSRETGFAGNNEWRLLGSETADVVVMKLENFEELMKPLEVFTNFAEDKNWDDAKRASKVKLLLRGEAQQYGGSASQHRAMQEFQGRQRKNGESIRDLSFALRLLYMRARPHDPSTLRDRELKFRIIQLLSAGIREALLKESNSDTCTLGTLVERTTRLEQVMSKNATASSPMIFAVDDRLVRLEQQLETLTAAVTRDNGTGRIGSVQLVTIDIAGCYRIELAGAKGGDNTYVSPDQLGGRGALAAGNFSLSVGVQLSIVVGQAGGPSQSSSYSSGGGGGGSFVYRTSDNELLMAAGGGGGASYGYSVDVSTMSGLQPERTGTGGANGQPGSNDQSTADTNSNPGGCGAGWLGKPTAARTSTEYGDRGGSRADGWVGGRAGDTSPADGGFGGGGGGGAAAIKGAAGPAEATAAAEPGLAATTPEEEAAPSAAAAAAWPQRGERVTDSEVSKPCAPTCIAWHPVKPILVCGWESGEASVWNEREKQLFEFAPIHKTEIRELAFNGKGIRLLTGDNYGTVYQWKLDMKGKPQPAPNYSAKVSGAVVSMLLQPISGTEDGLDLSTLAKLAVSGDERALDLFTSHNAGGSSRPGAHPARVGPAAPTGPIEANCFFVGTLNGSVHYLDEHGRCELLFSTEGAVKRLLYHQKRNLLISVTDSGSLSQHSIGPNGAARELTKFKLACRSPKPDIIWAGKTLLAMAVGETMVRFWDIASEDNYTLSMQDGMGYDSNVQVTSIAYSAKKQVLAAGTQTGQLAFWKYQPIHSSAQHEPEDEWQLQPPLFVRSNVSQLTWGTSDQLLGLNAVSDVYIITEQPASCHYGNGLSAVQTGPKSLYLANFNESIFAELQLESRLKQVRTTGAHLVCSDGRSITSYELLSPPGNSAEPITVSSLLKQVGEFQCDATQLDIYDQNVYTCETKKIQVRTLQGTVKQQLAFSDNHGEPVCFTINSHNLVVGSSRGVIRLFDLSRREAKAHGGEKFISEHVPRHATIQSVAVNSSGTCVSVVCVLDDLSVDPRVYVWDVEMDTVTYFNLRTGRSEHDENDRNIDRGLRASGNSEEALPPISLTPGDHGQLVLRCRAGSSGGAGVRSAVADELAEILGPENVGEVRVWAEVEATHWLIRVVTTAMGVGATGRGPVKEPVEPALARRSASSLPGWPECPGIHLRDTLLEAPKRLSCPIQSRTVCDQMVRALKGVNRRLTVRVEGNFLPPDALIVQLHGAGADGENFVLEDGGAGAVVSRFMAWWNAGFEFERGAERGRDSVREGQQASRCFQVSQAEVAMRPEVPLSEGKLLLDLGTRVKQTTAMCPALGTVDEGLKEVPEDRGRWSSHSGGNIVRIADLLNRFSQKPDNSSDKEAQARDLSGRYPISHHWDALDSRLLIVEAKLTAHEEVLEQFNITNNDKVMPDEAERMVISVFYSSDHGLWVQDSFAMHQSYSGLLRVDTPYFYFTVRPDMVAKTDQLDKSHSATLSSHKQYVAKRTMRDFVGLEESDKNSKEAMLDFSFYLTIGNIDEAFKMGHARGAMMLRQAQKVSDGNPDVVLAMLASQLGMRDEAERLLKSAQRYDLLTNFYRAEGQWEKAIDVAEKFDRMSLRTTHHEFAKHLESVGHYTQAVQEYLLADTHRTEVPRMLCDRPHELEAFDPQLNKWFALFLESSGDFNGAMQFYEAAKDYHSMVKLRCHME